MASRTQILIMKHLFFDVDGTITASRSKITDEMYSALSEIRFKYDIIFVSGASKEQMMFQTDNFPAEYLAQNGNDTEYWKNKIEDNTEIMAHMYDILLGYDVKDKIEHRGSQISLSMVGHHAPLELKKAYDPDKKKRKALLKKFPFKSDKFEVVIAGTTCFDYFLRGMNKGANLKRLIALKNWLSDECLYVGDSLFKGGNDESVKGVIPTKSVKDENETLKFVESL